MAFRLVLNETKCHLVGPSKLREGFKKNYYYFHYYFPAPLPWKIINFFQQLLIIWLQKFIIFFHVLDHFEEFQGFSPHFSFFSSRNSLC